MEKETTIFILDDVEDIRRHIKEKLINENLIELFNLNIIESDRREILQRHKNEKDSLPAPNIIVTDLYSSSDDYVALFEDLTPSIKENIPDEILDEELELLEHIVSIWSRTRVIVFSHYQESLHFTERQKQLIQETLEDLGIYYEFIVPKHPLDSGLQRIAELISSTLGKKLPNYFEGTSVIVVEDEERDLFRIIQRFQRIGVTVYPARSRKEGISKLISEFLAHSKLPDCIITDLYMPPEYEFAGIQMIFDLKQFPKFLWVTIAKLVRRIPFLKQMVYFRNILNRIGLLEEFRGKFSQVPIIVFSLYAKSKNLYGFQKRSISDHLRTLRIPEENIIRKSGKFEDRLEIVIRRYKDIIRKKIEEEKKHHVRSEFD